MPVATADVITGRIAIILITVRGIQGITGINAAGAVVLCWPVILVAVWGANVLPAIIANNQTILALLCLNAK